MLATVVCAVMCGARGFEAIAQWIHAHPPKVWYLLGFTRRPPTSGAFRYLLLKLAPEVLEEQLRQWAEEGLDQRVSEGDLEAVCLDGKTLCGTLTPHARALQLLSLLDQKIGCVLSQMAVPGDTNEAKAALQILETLVLDGRVVTADAMFCQRDVCEKIVDREGHYLIVVKDNQPELKEAIAAEFRAGFSPRHRRATRGVA